MYLDSYFVFDKTPLGLTGTSDVLGSNVYNAGSAKKLFEGFPQKEPRLHFACKITGGSGTITIRCRFVGADNAALSTNPIIIADTGAITLADDGTALDTTHNWVQRVLPLVGQTVAKQYYGPIYTPAGTTPTSDVTCVIGEAPQTYMGARKAAVP